MVAILKMAAIFVTGRIWDVPISKNYQLGIVYLWTKFHACFIKPTILQNIAPICCTNIWEKFQKPDRSLCYLHKSYKFNQKRRNFETLVFLGWKSLNLALEVWIIAIMIWGLLCHVTFHHRLTCQMSNFNTGVYAALKHLTSGHLTRKETVKIN